MKGLFQEKMEYLKTKFNTREGIFVWLTSSLIWGFIIVNYTQTIFSTVQSYIPLDPGFLLEYVSYLAFGIVLLPIGIVVTFVLTKLYSLLFKKNGRIISR